MDIQSISKKELDKFYNSHTNSETCKKFNISQTTLNKFLKQLKITMKGSGYKKVNIKE